jgi:hypothetical protein
VRERVNENIARDATANRNHAILRSPSYPVNPAPKMMMRHNLALHPHVYAADPARSSSFFVSQSSESTSPSSGETASPLLRR